MLRDYRDLTGCYDKIVSIEMIQAIGTRLWEFYFSYCEGGFEERAPGDVQMLFVKPGNRRRPILTPSVFLMA